MNNRASKTYLSKSSAKRAFNTKCNVVHNCGTSGEVNFGRIYLEENILYVESCFWTESTLKDFLDNKRELVQ